MPCHEIFICPHTIFGLSNQRKVSHNFIFLFETGNLICVYYDYSDMFRGYILGYPCSWRKRVKESVQTCTEHQTSGTFM